MKTTGGKRRDHRNPVPNRSASRPRPYQRKRARTLWRMALGFPGRTPQSRLRRPKPAERRRARRTLRLRSLARLRALPGLPARFLRWHWDRIWHRVPKPFDVQPLIPQPDPEPPAPKSPPTGPGLATVTPIRKAPSMSNPNEIIVDAFHQLAQFQPESAGEWSRFLAEQQEMFAQIGQAYQTLADNAGGGHAYNAAAAEHLRDLAAAVAGVGDIAQGAHQAFGLDQ